MRKISLFVLSAAFALTTLVGCNSAAEQVVEESVIEEDVEETTPEPIEEVAEEPVDETPAFVFGQEEPEYHQVFYGSEDINNKVEELIPIYPDMSGADILALVNLVNAYDYKLGAASESESVYGVVRFNYDNLYSNVEISDFLINPQARDYALVLEECYKNDRTQWENYMREDTNVEYSYEFMYSGSLNNPTANTAITGVKFWELSHDLELSDDVIYGGNYWSNIISIILGEFSFENEQ